MKRKIIMLIVIFLIIAIIAGIAIYQKNNNKTDSNSTVIKMNEVTRSVFYAPQYVAINKGYFKDYNIEIDLTTGQGADAVMTSVCENDCSINTYRAYIYYIKSIGNQSETRKVYKKAYDAFEGEEREMFKKNWLTWEKTFGNAKSINEAISYTKAKDKNMRIFNKIKIIIIYKN